MKSVEEKLWDYIDGVCSFEEQKDIRQLIADDAVFRSKYNELMQIQNDMDALDLDMPSMSFTNKVMDKIALQSAPLSAKARINKRIIYAIAGIFSLMLLICLGWFFSQLNFTSSSNAEINFSGIFNQTSFSGEELKTLGYGLMVFNTVALLMLFNNYLRRKLAQ